MKKKIFYAVSKRGQGRVFTSKPVFEADGMEVPDIKWKDDPVEFEISIGLP